MVPDTKSAPREERSTGATLQGACVLFKLTTEERAAHYCDSLTARKGRSLPLLLACSEMKIRAVSC